jgi:DNA-binding winged helix-turn-helix (wHTH) protein
MVAGLPGSRQTGRMALVIDGTFECDPDALEVRRNGVAVALEPQAIDVLLYLIRHRDRVVSKEELMDEVWGNRFVSESSVTSRIKQVRKALGDDGQHQRLIRTMRGRGYRFVATVTSADPTPTPSPSPLAEQRRSPVRYTLSDDLNIAYQVSGGGDQDIVLIPGFISHLEIDWDDPRHAYFLEKLGTMGRLIRFDKRGTGMSDRPSELPDLETRMHDVLAVMNAVRCKRAVLVGYSEGGPMSVMMAALHPERVSALVLYGSYARRARSDDYPWGRTPEEHQIQREQLANRWDWEEDLRWRCPSSDGDMQRWWARRMRAAATPATVRALMNMNALVDVRDVLPSVRVPTLVLHRVGDALFDVGEAKYLAEHIPDAKLKLLDGADHMVCGNPAQLIEAMAPFILSTSAAPPRRGLAAVAAPHGRPSAAVLSAMVEGGGRLRTTVDGARVVLFDGPATAVRCSTGALSSASGSEASIGISIAEVPLDDSTISGPGVDLAIQLSTVGEGGSVLVSKTASSLLASTDIVLDSPPGGHGLDESTEYLRVRQP